MSIDFKTELGKIKILMLKGEKGDAGQDGSSGDYSQLTNKPTINGIEVNGTMTSDDLGLASETGLQQAITDFSTALSDIIIKQSISKKETFTANQSKSLSYSVNTPTGYKPIAITDFYWGAVDQFAVLPKDIRIVSGLQLTNTDILFTALNTSGNSTGTGSISFDMHIIYIKSAYLG